MYTGVPPHIAHMKNNATSTAFFMRDEIKLDLLSRQTAVLSVVEGATGLYILQLEKSIVLILYELITGVILSSPQRTDLSWLIVK